MSAVIGVVSASALVAWLVYDRTHGTGGTYIEALVAIYHSPAPADSQSSQANAADEDRQNPDSPRDRHFTRAALYRMNDLSCLTVPGLWKGSSSSAERIGVSTILGAIVLGVLALGWWRISSRQIDVLAILLPIYLLLYAHWDCAQPGGRFLLPMLPVILACVGSGLIAILRPAARLGVRWQTPLVAVYLLAHLGQSAGYWLLIDAPRAQECQQNLPLADRLADKIQTHPGYVSVAPSLERICNGLWLDLDFKRVRMLQRPPQRRVEWIVDVAGSAPIDGFSLECVDGPVQLLHRDASAQNSHEQVGQEPATAVERH
jgi:hypothetical protein